MLRRFTIILAVSILPIQMASGDEVHHNSFATALVGSWAQRAELCTADDKTNVTIAETSFTDADGKCTVETIVEKGATSGTIYSARGRCTDAEGKFHAANLIVRTEANDKLSIGTTFDGLKPYQRCPAR
jgi:hypothetical protein